MKLKLVMVSLMAMTAAGAAFAQGPAMSEGHASERGHHERPHRAMPFMPVQDFSAADRNTDGLLDAEEIAAHMLAGMQEPMAERAARMVAFLDRDDDGKLSADEMTPERPDPFAAMDTDGDGQISRTEFDAMAERMREQAPRGPRGPRPPAPPVAE